MFQNPYANLLAQNQYYNPQMNNQQIYPQEQTQNLIRVKFTFHYGSIQMKSAWTNLLTGISIYIPLWFYSNQHREPLMVLIINLHSTMVLFKFFYPYS